MLVRSASAIDLPQILDILNREIAEGVAHFGLEPVPLGELSQDFESGAHPWFVAAEGQAGGESVLGFARAYAWKPRGAYARTAEVGVYVRPESQGRGIGKLLYAQFLPAAFEAGFHTLIAGIRLPNDPCVRLHEGFGFRKVGELPQVGFKFGQWHDVGYWALLESQFPTSPTR
jgi:phosphinothricin acetyltransferase